MKENKLRILTYVVMAYMLLAFAWWSILLFQKNQDAFRAKKEFMRLVKAAEGIVETESQFLKSAEFLELQEKYKRQEWMIFGEAVVFVISLVIGVWLINRGYNRAIHTARQSKNFLLSITHELKSPIASIQLTLETFLKRKLPPEKFDKLCNNALIETERLNKLVSDLLLASRMETAYQARLEEVNLSQLIKGIIDKLQTKYPLAQLNFQGTKEDLIGELDLLGMTSVAINLIENAIKYSFEDVVVDIDLNYKDGWMNFIVADKGIGIKSKDKKKVFDRFYRVGDEDTRKTKGTGLGLYIVHEIVKVNNGSIEVENNQPKGTVFKVNLPMKMVDQTSLNIA